MEDHVVDSQSAEQSGTHSGLDTVTVTTCLVLFSFLFYFSELLGLVRPADEAIPWFNDEPLLQVNSTSVDTVTDCAVGLETYFGFFFSRMYFGRC